MLKTLAAKHRSSVSKMTAKYKARIDKPNGIRVCFEARIECKLQEIIGGNVRWGSAPATAGGENPRPTACLGGLSSQGADHAAPVGHLRNLRKHR